MCCLLGFFIYFVLPVCVLAYYAYYVYKLIGEADSEFKTKSEARLALIPYYMVFKIIKDYYSDLKD